MISPSLPINGFYAGAAPATAIVEMPPFWTPVVYAALAVELAWLLGGLVFLWWLTGRTYDDRTDPRRPKRHASREEPPLAA